jgi:hypothetical protein
MTKTFCHNGAADVCVGIIGGGIAGSTIALKLSELGIKVHLFEKGPSLVNGPPICHLHAGGNLYREISDEQCLTLLRQSIDTLKLYPHAVDYRPTVIAIPQHDKNSPDQLIPQLALLQEEYSKLIDEDTSNQVLGNADEYFKLYDRSRIEHLAQQTLSAAPETADQWMVSVAKYLDLDKLQFPLVLVQEYGMSVFRLAATVSLSLEKNKHCQVVTDAKVKHVTIEPSGLGWYIDYLHNGEEHNQKVDYLINACGFRTGIIDDMVSLERERMVEFKAAYIAHWPDTPSQWPELIFMGERGTPQGMAQLTPYPDGYFQIHGMTPDITLFKGGLVSNKALSSQPKLPDKLLTKIDDKWPADVVLERTQKAIAYINQYVPEFANAALGGNPLYGAQQIPGDDPSLRVANISFCAQRYARCEIVKASSALAAADSIFEWLAEHNDFQLSTHQCTYRYFPITNSICEAAITKKAKQLAKERGYPLALAQRNVKRR